MSNSLIKSVDIAICTWNREHLLARTLDSVSKIVIPDGVELSVLIVDNNSPDKTQNVIQDFCESEFAKSINVVSLFEEKQGHTFSRNCAVGSSHGDLIIWTDDDVQVATDWLERYVMAASAQASISFWGSVIEPEFTDGTPRWISENWELLKGCFAHRDLGEQSVNFSDGVLPYGANFAIRGEVQREFLFETELGRRGDLLMGEDELELMRRLLDAGHRGTWVPGAVAKHLIPKSRSTHRFVYEYFVGQGQSLVARGTPWHTDRAKLKSEADSEYRKYWLKRWWASSNVWCSHLLRSGLARGQFEALG